MGEEKNNVQGKTAHSRRLQERVGRELADAKTHYERLVRATRGFVFTVLMEDGKPVKTIYHDGSAETTGYTAHDFAEDPSLWIRMVHLEDRPRVLEQVDAILRGESTEPVEHRILHRDGSLRWVRNTSLPRHDDQGRMIAYDGMVVDITARRKAEEERDRLLVEMSRLAGHDPLTGLLNRRGLEEALEQLWEMRRRYRNPFSILVLDIDFFKTINDTYGHRAGDTILIEVAAILRQTTRSADVLGRYGGDEMVALLPMTTAGDAEALGTRVLEAVRTQVFLSETHALRLAISIGVADSEVADPASSAEMLQRADKALYLSKRGGRDRFSVWRPDLPADTAATAPPANGS